MKRSLQAAALSALVALYAAGCSPALPKPDPGAIVMPISSVAKVEYLPSENAKDLKLEKALYETLALDEVTARATRYYYNRIDLNNDQRLEYFVLVSGPYVSGQDGNPAFIFSMQDDQSLQLVQKFDTFTAPVIVSQDSTNGWRDLILERKGASDEQLLHLSFQNGGYLGLSQAQLLPKEAAVGGIGLISNDLTKQEDGAALMIDPPAAP